MGGGGTHLHPSTHPLPSLLSRDKLPPRLLKVTLTGSPLFLHQGHFSNNYSCSLPHHHTSLSALPFPSAHQPAVLSPFFKIIHLTPHPLLAPASTSLLSPLQKKPLEDGSALTAPPPLLQSGCCATARLSPRSPPDLRLNLRPHLLCHH